MAVDASMRNLKVPAKFIPYLEKHRIYELFHELGERLAMERPDDTLIYLKKSLEHLDKQRDKRLVLLMQPPFLDRIKLAHLISVKTGCSILSRYIASVTPGNFQDPIELAVNTADIIKHSDKEGWILSDYPDTAEEAKQLILRGVLPTHAFLLLPDCQANSKADDSHLRSVQASPSILLEYDNSIHRLEELFRSSLKVVKIKDQSLEELANICAKLVMEMPRRHYPRLFRVCIIGPRGSKRRTIAKILHKKFKLVHVDIENLINAVKSADSDLGDEFRYLDRMNMPLPLHTVFDILKTRLYQEDCIKRGYVLTNFPCSLEEFVLLDSIDTPPNRVIFLDIGYDECLERLEDRVVNMHTGALHSKKAMLNNKRLKSQTLPHPDDEHCKVIEELKFYNDRVKSMIEYCGESCYVVEASGPVSALLERVEAVLMGPPQACKPRSRKLSLPVYEIKKQSEINKTLRMDHTLSRISVIPLIDSEDLMRRFHHLKNSGKHVTQMEEPSEIISIHNMESEEVGLVNGNSLGSVSGEIGDIVIELDGEDNGELLREPDERSYLTS